MIASASSFVVIPSSKPYQHGASHGLPVSQLLSINDGSAIVVGVGDGTGVVVIHDDIINSNNNIRKGDLLRYAINLIANIRFPYPSR